MEWRGSMKGGEPAERCRVFRLGLELLVPVLGNALGNALKSAGPTNRAACSRPAALAGSPQHLHHPAGSEQQQQQQFGGSAPGSVVGGGGSPPKGPRLEMGGGPGSLRGGGSPPRFSLRDVADWSYPASTLGSPVSHKSG